jgi:vacuolar-type H+-ATPase subunit H
MTKPSPPEHRVDDPAEEAIAAVLRAEREAHQAVERSQAEARQIAEDARSSARSVAERTERRIRAVVGAFERELADRLAEVDAEAARIATPHELSASELDALGRAVSALARELTGARP